jgi:hypothetical protein
VLSSFLFYFFLQSTRECRGDVLSTAAVRTFCSTPLLNFLRSIDQGCHADVFGRTDDRTMAAGASVTWTHCSVLFEVTWGKKRCVRVNTKK